MKPCFLLLISCLFFFAAPAQAQQSAPMPASVVLADNTFLPPDFRSYPQWPHYRKRQVLAFSMLALGCVALPAGAVCAAVGSQLDNGSALATVGVVGMLSGATLTLASIPIFASAAKMKNAYRPPTLSLLATTQPLAAPSRFAASQPAIGLSLNF